MGLSLPVDQIKKNNTDKVYDNTEGTTPSATWLEEAFKHLLWFRFAEFDVDT